jgi:hypothetical protein
LVLLVLLARPVLGSLVLRELLVPSVPQALPGYKGLQALLVVARPVLKGLQVPPVQLDHRGPQVLLVLVLLAPLAPRERLALLVPQALRVRLVLLVVPQALRVQRVRRGLQGFKAPQEQELQAPKVLQAPRAHEGLQALLVVAVIHHIVIYSRSWVPRRCLVRLTR